MDLLIKNARMRGRDGLMEIAISKGGIQKIAKKCPGKAEKTIDAKGNLVTESYCNAHLHLCKVWTLQMMDEKALKDYHGSDMGKAMTAIELAARVKEKYDEKWIIKNVRKAVELAARYGNLHIRAFVDVDTKARLEGIKAVLKAREEYKGIVNIQVVAFPQDGVVRDPGAEQLIVRAMDMGADVVGGIPWIEYTEEDERIHIQKMVAIARKYKKDVSMLVDDAGDPTLKTIEMLATETIKTGWQGRVLAQHARAMCLYPKPYFQKVAALLKKAGMGVVSDPHTGPLHARVKELLEEGVQVCLGQDDISDAYYPYGRNNMLEIAFLASHLLWMTT
ncbi:MAG: amidohydrolase family protein, partial [Elusimicrobia bacterium]|nr:amidohydrolase family protein [Elusimicrobiota bacterium]